MASPIKTPGFNSTSYPSIARVNDFWLGGVNHDQGHQEYAERIEMCAPHIPYLVRASRQLTGRMVRYLLDKGVRQFLDLGSGIPTGLHVHQVARSADPQSRVVYVDLDPTVAADAHGMLADQSGVAYLQADIRRRDEILRHPDLTRLIDLREPVGVLCIETLLYLPDAGDPGGLISSYMDAVPAGSYLGLSHCSENEGLRAGLDLFSRMFGQPPAVTLRDRDQLQGFFGDLELVDPGVVPVTLWNPLTEEDMGRNPELAHMFAGLARKT